MAELKSGWRSHETQLGVGGAVSALIVAGLTVYFGVSAEQATTIAAGLVTAGALLWKAIEARRANKESAAKVDVARIVAGAGLPAVAPPEKQWLDVPPSMLNPDPYGREGDVSGS